MSCPGEMQTDCRVVLNFRTELEVRTNGHCRLFVKNLHGEIIETYDGKDAADVEHQLIRAGFQRIPPAMADDLDMFRLGILLPRGLRRGTDI